MMRGRGKRERGKEEKRRKGFSIPGHFGSRGSIFNEYKESVINDRGEKKQDKGSKEDEKWDI